MQHLDLFSGIGGFSRASDFLGWETTDFVEQDSYCQQVLKKHYPHARIHPDVTTYRGTRKSHQIITAGFPCQDVSLANHKRKGLEGDRSILFYEDGRIINEVLPLGFCLENVPGIYKYLPDIIAYFAEGGLYELRWFSLRVNQLGGAHRRERVFILGKLANPQSIYGGTPGNKNHQAGTIKTSISSGAKPSSSRGENKSKVCDSDDGIPGELARDLMTPEQSRERIKSSLKTIEDWGKDDGKKLKALGNAVTPQQAYLALKTLKHWLEIEENRSGYSME
jgi:DNA (cytosine-5)-methyltransferase 1